LSQKPNQDAKSIGARFRSARSLVPDLNRKSFCERYGINRYTMQSWENGLHVSKGKNVEKFIEALTREGVYCTSEWLIEGIGESAKPLLGINHPPSLTTDTHGRELISGHHGKLDSIIDKLSEAHAEIDDALICFRLQDDAMAPKFLTGDVVFGRSIAEDDKPSVHQKYCIIELGLHRLIVRKVLCTKEGFLLLALDERLPTFTLNLNSQLFEIVWHLVNQ
jgi:hypothetical protein